MADITLNLSYDEAATLFKLLQGEQQLAVKHNTTLNSDLIMVMDFLVDELEAYEYDHGMVEAPDMSGATEGDR
jgi:hypothetical protein